MEADQDVRWLVRALTQRLGDQYGAWPRGWKTGGEVNWEVVSIIVRVTKRRHDWWGGRSRGCMSGLEVNQGVAQLVGRLTREVAWLVWTLTRVCVPGGEADPKGCLTVWEADREVVWLVGRLTKRLCDFSGGWPGGRAVARGRAGWRTGRGRRAVFCRNDGGGPDRWTSGWERRVGKNIYKHIKGNYDRLVSIAKQGSAKYMCPLIPR